MSGTKGNDGQWVRRESVPTKFVPPFGRPPHPSHRVYSRSNFLFLHGGPAQQVGAGRSRAPLSQASARALEFLVPPRWLKCGPLPSVSKMPRKEATKAKLKELAPVASPEELEELFLELILDMDDDIEEIEDKRRRAERRRRRRAARRKNF